MFASIFGDPRRKRRRPRIDASSHTASYHDHNSRRRMGERTRTSTPNRNDETHFSDSEDGDEAENDNDDDDTSNDQENEDGSEDTPLLPIFDATLLDALPIYALTHTVRILVTERCETVLSWEQLRSPQVSQFLLKPIQQEVKTNSFSAATIYVLMANCLQFTKEVATNPGNSGTSSTRAMVCELLAIKLLREYTTRGLIDALSYDFDPLQGQNTLAPAAGDDVRASWQSIRRTTAKTARISCLEIAIRAQAKRFLAHPLVVQHLQAVWDGSIVFHNASDSLHRKSLSLMQPNYGTGGQHMPNRETKATLMLGRPRKMVTLYNPRDASILKLSRLRVPRYRNILSTISLAVLLGLFVAVLVERSQEITPLEVIFWFWAAGYMLDEVVTFTEQGFGLYIASFWNTFDLGILLLLVIHFCLRIYGLVTPTAHKHSTASLAYDILAASAILLFPRLFSVLDHYRYFSQLIIAFRMMAADLMAVFILIVIACSGFFIALSLSFGQDSPDSPTSVGFALFQLIMGFTPAAWDRWDLYTPLGRCILTLYMFITHFVVVTILVSVLTNSFMAVVQNANEEHQFLFAVNTISSVKSDSLFSYVPPLNVLQWLMYPTRFILPFRRYIQWNRTVIKVTHLPILFGIFLYERTVLRSSIVDTIDLIESRHVQKMIARRLPRLLREPSVVNFRQDQALEEVFKRPFDETIRISSLQNQQKASNVVNEWMNDMGDDDAGPPEEQDRKILNRLERRQPIQRHASAYSRGRKFSRRTMSVVSDPADIASHADFFSPSPRTAPVAGPIRFQHDDADGDDELVTNDLDEDDRMTTDVQEQQSTALRPPQNDYFYLRPTQRPSIQRDPSSQSSTNNPWQVAPASGGGKDSPATTMSRRKSRGHKRTVSSTTMIFAPPDTTETEDIQGVNVVVSVPEVSIDQIRDSIKPGSKQSSAGTDPRLLKRKGMPNARPNLPYRDDPLSRSSPDLPRLKRHDHVQPPARRTSLELDLVSDIGDNKAIGGGYVGAIPASFATRMAYATGGLRHLQRERQDEQERLSRIMMARMNSLEEGFRDVIHEMRESMKPQSNTPTSRRSRSNERYPKANVSSRKERDRDALKSSQRIKSNGGSVSSVVPSPTILINDEITRPSTAIAIKPQDLSTIVHTKSADADGSENDNEGEEGKNLSSR